jgi:heptosyltransferase III
MDAPRIIISRTDAMGDVVLALPMAGMIKRHHPRAHVSFLGRAYTRPIAEACEHVDRFLDWDEVANATEADQKAWLEACRADAIVHVQPRKAISGAAREAGIPVRIGMARRWWGLRNSNRRLFFGRRHSKLHETQLNLKMLRPLGLREIPSLPQVPELYGLTRTKPLSKEHAALLDTGRINVILHAKSMGHAPEWGVENFAALLELLSPERYHVFLTGTRDDEQQIGGRLPANRAHVTRLYGKLSLEELIAFIGRADALVASSTGPLHVAAALGILAIGLFTKRPSKNVSRWGPAGVQGHGLEFDRSCLRCRLKLTCDCVTRIPPAAVLAILERYRPQPPRAEAPNGVLRPSSSATKTR